MDLIFFASIITSHITWCRYSGYSHRYIDSSTVLDSCFLLSCVDEIAVWIHAQSLISWFASHMFDSPHIHITTLCCFDWPVTLLSLISLHGTESDYYRPPPEISQNSSHTIFPPVKTIHLLEKKPKHIFTQSSLPTPPPPPPPSVCPLVKALVKGELTIMQQHPSSSSSPPLLIPRHSHSYIHPDTHALTAHFRCLLSWPN